MLETDSIIYVQSSLQFTTFLWMCALPDIFFFLHNIGKQESFL